MLYVVLMRVMKTNLRHYLSPVYFVSQPLHVSGIFVAHHQEVYCVCVCVCMYTHTHTHTNKQTQQLVRVVYKQYTSS